MNIKLQTWMFPILFLCASFSIFSQEARPSQLFPRDSLSQEHRATESFRILNDAGTEFENMLNTVGMLVVAEEITKAQDECRSFLQDISAIGDSLNNDRKLTPEDIRYVGRNLKSYQKIGESILEDLRYRIKVDN